MNTFTIDGKCYARMLHGGAATLAAHAEELNALNVFPVCDGDTGTNMLKTMRGGLSKIDGEAGSVAQISESFAQGILLAARGNSGVILSQIFAGIHQGLRHCDSVGAGDLSQAFGYGIEKAYAAVQNPTEGTILTVLRESTEYATANLQEGSTVEDFFQLLIDEAERSLVRTKELLPVLAEADVVDSGGAGYLCIAQGMYSALRGEPVSFELVAEKESEQVDIDRFTRDSVLEFGYCTEFLLRLTTAKVDPDSFDIQIALDVLQELGGESVVAYKQDDILKVHVHTFHPGDILARMQAFGEFLTVKIENMSLGHSGQEEKKPKSNKAFSVVAVASGEGIGALFGQMGADQIISGGQTANPSIQEFVEAFDACDTKDIIVLPNNKNVLLAAKQAAELYTDANVHVVQSKTLMQGYSALSVITPGITDIQSLVNSAQRAADSIADGEITRAVRDTAMNGITIHTGDYIAISEGAIVAVAETAEEVALKMLETMDTDLCEIITLFAGKDVTAENRAALTEQLKERYEDCQIEVYEGGQEVYDYLIAVE